MSEAAPGVRLRVLMSAYACEPRTGSEQAVGWNIARTVAEHAEVWVLTRRNNRPAIEQELARDPAPYLHFVYFDLPDWTRVWKRLRGGVQVYYYLWQLGIGRMAKALHDELHFDVVHHVTFAKYWAPSFACRVPAPFVWGPVGGGESTPPGLWPDLQPRHRRFERVRDVARFVGERDPLVRWTARRSAIALASTENTADRLRAMGVKRVRTLSQVGIAEREIGWAEGPDAASHVPMRVVSVGLLLHWKGFHLGLRAFADAALPDAEYWILGSGPEREHLAREAERLGIAGQVTFFGHVPREEVLARLAQCQVMMHPSMHDSGGFVCLEAMALGMPVICLDTGGPAVLVDDGSGIKARCSSSANAVDDMAAGLQRLARDPERRALMGEHARTRALETFSWHAKAQALLEVYRDAMEGPRP